MDVTQLFAHEVYGGYVKKMAGEIDEHMAAIRNRLKAPQSLFERDFVERQGVRLPVFKNAPQSLPHLFNQYCTQFQDKPFLIDGDVRLTFGEVHAYAQRAARQLVTHYGVQKGDRIAIAAHNSANWIIAYMAILMAGGCATLLNGWWTGKELADGIALAQPGIVLADPERTARLTGHDVAARIVTFGHKHPADGLAPILSDASASDTCPETVLPELTGDDLATILFTSGSTGRAKAACSDHRAVVHATMSFAVKYHALSTTLHEAGTPPAGDQAALLSVPLFHVTGTVATMLLSFYSGRRIVIMPKWDAREAMRLIEKERVTFFVGVPLMGHEIATHPERVNYDLSSCETFASGGSARPTDHILRARESFPDAFQVLGYGLTETNCMGCTNVSEQYLAKPTSTGPANSPLVEMKILGADGEALPAGECGEIAIRSICNFREYWNEPEATMEAVRPDGFFLTGDIGYLDEDGYLFIVDRKKDIIIRGGENIACNEVEMALYGHPNIAEVSVFGLPDDHFGEVPVAVYRPASGITMNEDELRAFLRERIATFKIPVRFWEETGTLPRLGTEKIDKVALKARYSQNWERARSAA